MMKPGTPLPRIADVVVAASHSVHVTWTDGSSVTVDLAGWIARGGAAFAGLLEPGLFAAVEVADYGTALQWGDEDDDLTIDVAHLLLLAEEQRPMTAADVAAWQDAVRLSNNEAADMLGIQRSTWNAYKRTGRFPKSIQIALRAARRDPLIIEAHLHPRRSGRPRRASSGDAASPTE